MGLSDQTCSRHLLPADVKMAKELDWDENAIIELLKKRIYNVHMCVGISSIILRPAVSVSHAGAGPNLALDLFYHSNAVIPFAIHTTWLSSQYLAILCTLWAKCCCPFRWVTYTFVATLVLWRNLVCSYFLERHVWIHQSKGYYRWTVASILYQYGQSLLSQNTHPNRTR